MAGLVAYEIEASANLEELNASRFLYKNSNQGLLAGSEVMGVATTTSGCFVKQTYLVDDRAVFSDDLAFSGAGQACDDSRVSPD